MAWAAMIAYMAIKALINYTNTDGSDYLNGGSGQGFDELPLMVAQV